MSPASDSEIVQFLSQILNYNLPLIHLMLTALLPSPCHMAETPLSALSAYLWSPLPRILKQFLSHLSSQILNYNLPRIHLMLKALLPSPCHLAGTPLSALSG